MAPTVSPSTVTVASDTRVKTARMVYFSLNNEWGNSADLAEVRRIGIQEEISWDKQAMSDHIDHGG